MGMSASQARLLFISSRIHDVEMKSMNIANQKIRLASESEQVSNDYVKALNQTNFMITDTSTGKSQQLNYNMIMSYGGLLDSYSLRDKSGNVVISKDMENKFKAAGGDVNKFIDSYGVERSSAQIQGEYSSEIVAAQKVYDEAEDALSKAKGVYDPLLSQLEGLKDTVTNKDSDLSDFKASYPKVGFNDETGDVDFSKARSKVPGSETKTGSVAQSGTANRTSNNGSVTYTEISDVETSKFDEEVDGYIVTTEITTQFSQDFSEHWVRDSGGWCEDRPADVGSMQEIYHNEVQYKHDYSIAEEKKIPEDYKKLLKALADAEKAVSNFENGSTYKNAKQNYEKAVSARTSAASNLSAIKKQFADELATAPMNNEERWYTDLFSQMMKGYIVYNGDVLNNKETLEAMIKNGEWLLSQKDESGKYVEQSTSTISMINEETDNTGIARAEAEYNAKTKKINNKEKILDNELKKLDTEHSALTTEQDSIKNLIKDNTDKTFNLFS